LFCLWAARAVQVRALRRGRCGPRGPWAAQVPPAGAWRTVPRALTYSALTKQVCLGTCEFTQKCATTSALEQYHTSAQRYTLLATCDLPSGTIPKFSPERSWAGRERDTSGTVFPSQARTLDAVSGGDQARLLLLALALRGRQALLGLRQLRLQPGALLGLQGAAPVSACMNDHCCNWCSSCRLCVAQCTSCTATKRF